MQHVWIFFLFLKQFFKGWPQVGLMEISHVLTAYVFHVCPVRLCGEALKVLLESNWCNVLSTKHHSLRWHPAAVAEIASDLAEFHSRQAPENAAAPPSAVESLNCAGKPSSEKPGGTTQGSADAVAWIVCGLLFIAALKRAERKKQHSSAARYQVSVWNRTCALTRGPVALIMFCPSLLLSGFKFTNSTIAIWSSHLSTLRAQWVSGIIGYMAWFTYLNFGLCAACLRLSPTTCYSFVLPTRDIPLLIEIEWKALPWRLHLAAFSKESVSHVLCSQLTWCRNHEII